MGLEPAMGVRFGRPFHLEPRGEKSDNSEMENARRSWVGEIVPRWVLWPPAAILAVLLFAGGPGYHSPRSLHAFWDLGHLGAFFLWTYLLLTGKRFGGASHVRHWTAGLAFCITAGAGSEWIQSLTGRDASLDDILRDIVGGLLALSWIVPSVKNLPPGARRTARGLSASFLLIAFLPLATALGDEMAARSGFPVLSDFETPLERSRWEGGARFEVDSTVARHGKASLRVEMDTSLYSGVSLAYFPGDWRGYRYLAIEVLNPSPDLLEITCRIHDRRHEEGDRRYQDRFNRFYRLPPGWNELRIDLGDVARTPAGRTMDLGEIRSVGLFAMKLPKPRTMYLDSVRLE